MGIVISLLHTFRESIKTSRSRNHQQQQESQSQPQPPSTSNPAPLLLQAPAPSSQPESPDNLRATESQQFSPTQQAQQPPLGGEAAALRSEGQLGAVPSSSSQDRATVGSASRGLAAATLPASSDSVTTTGQANQNTMASDGDYMSFLNKANEDPNEGQGGAAVKGQSGSGSGGKIQFKATDARAEVPSVLKAAVKDAFYVSDADEPFEVVSLKLGGKGLPDEISFAKLINHPSPEEAEVSILDPSEWDAQGQYAELVKATREATKGGDVRVYRIAKDGSRVEYWLVGVAEGKLVGVKALAIES